MQDIWATGLLEWNGWGGGGGGSGLPAQVFNLPNITLSPDTLGIVSYWETSFASNGKTVYDFMPFMDFSSVPLIDRVVPPGNLRYVSVRATVNPDFSVTYELDISEAIFVFWPIVPPLPLGDINTAGAVRVYNAWFVNTGVADLTIGVDNSDLWNIINFPSIGQAEWKTNSPIIYWNAANNEFRNRQAYNELPSGGTNADDPILMDFFDWFTIPDGSSLFMIATSIDGDNFFVPDIAQASTILGRVQIDNNTGSPLTIDINDLSNLNNPWVQIQCQQLLVDWYIGTWTSPELNASGIQLYDWYIAYLDGSYQIRRNGNWEALWGWATPYNYIINRANFMFIPETWELYQTETAKIYVNWDIKEWLFGNAPSFTLNDSEFVYLLGKYDGSRTRELWTINSMVWDFDNDWLPIILIRFDNYSWVTWSYNTQASDGIQVQIKPVYWNSSGSSNQVGEEVAKWYRLSEWNTTTNTTLTGVPVRLVTSWLVNNAKFLTDNVYMSPQTFGRDMMTPFDWDTKFFAQSQSTGSGTATFNLASVDKDIGEFVFYSGSAFSNIEQVLRQIPLGGNKIAVGWLDNMWDGYIAIGTTNYSSISFGTEVVSNVDVWNQIAVKLDTDRFAIVWENGTDVVCASYDVTGTTFAIDSWPQVITSMTPTQIATLCKWANFVGSIVQVAIDKFVMCPSSDTISFVVDTSAGITSGSNAPVTSWVYNSVVWVDAISRLVWITNNGTDTSWYIVWVSGTTLTFSGQSWWLTSDTIEYKIANSNGDSVSMVWVADAGDLSHFRAIRGTVSVSSFSLTGYDIGQAFWILQSNFLKVRNLYYLETDSVSEWFMFWGTQSSNPTQWLMMVFHSQALETYSYTSLNEYYITDYKFNDYVGVISHQVTVFSAWVPITYVQVNALGSMLNWFSISDNWSVVYIAANGRSLTPSDDNFVAGIQYTPNNYQPNIYLTKDLKTTVSRFVDTDTYLDTGTDTLSVPFWAKDANVLAVWDSTAPWTFDISTINWLVVGNTYKIYPDTWCVLNIILTPTGSSASGRIMSDSWRPSILVSEATNDYIVIEVLANGEIELVKYVSDWAIINLDVPATDKITITSAEILTGNTSPVTILPSPWVNKIYDIKVVLERIENVVTPYATNTTSYISYAGQGIGNAIALDTALLPSAVDVMVVPTGNAVVPLANTAITWIVDTGNPTAWDGNLEITIQYKIINI